VSALHGFKTSPSCVGPQRSALLTVAAGCSQRTGRLQPRTRGNTDACARTRDLSLSKYTQPTSTVGERSPGQRTVPSTRDGRMADFRRRGAKITLVSTYASVRGLPISVVAFPPRRFARPPAQHSTPFHSGAAWPNGANAMKTPRRSRDHGESVQRQRRVAYCRFMAR
jgi:hypothetical protein